MTDAQSDQLAGSDRPRRRGPGGGSRHRQCGGRRRQAPAITVALAVGQTPPTTPGGLSASTFGDGSGETWLTWGASTDNATPTTQLVYEVYLNGHFDQPVGGGYTQAILYVELNALNTIEVVAVDGAGNRSAPASATVETVLKTAG